MLHIDTELALLQAAVTNNGKNHDLQAYIHIGRLPTPRGQFRYVVIVPDTIMKRWPSKQLVLDTIQRNIWATSGTIGGVTEVSATLTSDYPTYFAFTDWHFILVDITVKDQGRAQLEWVLNACAFLEQPIPA
jgi:hypothetical protein